MDFYNFLRSGSNKLLRGIPPSVRAASTLFNQTTNIEPFSSAKPPLSPAMANAVGLSSLIGRSALGALQIPAIVEQTAKVLNPNNNILTSIQNVGTALKNQGRPYTRQYEYMGSDPSAVRENQRIRNAKLSEKGYTSYGTYIQPGVGEFDLATGRPINTSPTASLRIPAPKGSDFVRGGGSTGDRSAGYYFSGGGPAERAYQQEVSRVAQLTAQDPELQRYETARKTAVAPGATPEQVQSAEDIGMKIWAQKYGNLAQKVKPGQAGYDVIQQTINPPAPGAPTWLSGFGANPYNISSSASFQAPAAVGIDATQVPAAAALTPSMASTPALAIKPPSQEVLDETQRKLLLQAFR